MISTLINTILLTLSYIVVNGILEFRFVAKKNELTKKMSFTDFLLFKLFGLSMVFTKNKYIKDNYYQKSNPIITILTILFKPWFMVKKYDQKMLPTVY